MKLLLDENVPVKLRYRFSERGIQVSTISEQKWNSKKNGELLQLMIDAGFTHFITFDSNLSFQQNLVKFPIPVIIISAPFNNYDTIIVMVGVDGLQVQKNEPTRNAGIVRVELWCIVA